MDEQVNEVPIYIDRAETLEEMALTLAERTEAIFRSGGRIVSISHAVDHNDPDGKPYSCMIVGEPRFYV
jgi:hypothetical protein